MAPPSTGTQLVSTAGKHRVGATIRYVLDANVFIAACRKYYAFDLVPAFWQALTAENQAGRITSIDRVRLELERGKDTLATWAADHQGMFASTDDDAVIRSYRDIMTWLQAQGQFQDAAKAAFAGGADGWLIAFAKAHGHVVVTHEQPSAESKRRVLIPNVCNAVGVTFSDPFAMLRQLGLTFA